MGSKKNVVVRAADAIVDELIYSAMPDGRSVGEKYYAVPTALRFVSAVLYTCAEMARMAAVAAAGNALAFDGDMNLNDEQRNGTNLSEHPFVPLYVVAMMFSRFSERLCCAFAFSFMSYILSIEYFDFNYILRFISIVFVSFLESIIAMMAVYAAEKEMSVSTEECAKVKVHYGILLCAISFEVISEYFLLNSIEYLKRLPLTLGCSVAESIQWGSRYGTDFSFEDNDGTDQSSQTCCFVSCDFRFRSNLKKFFVWLAVGFLMSLIEMSVFSKHFHDKEKALPYKSGLAYGAFSAIAGMQMFDRVLATVLKSLTPSSSVWGFLKLFLLFTVSLFISILAGQALAGEGIYVPGQDDHPVCRTETFDTIVWENPSAKAVSTLAATTPFAFLTAGAFVLHVRHKETDESGESVPLV